MATTQKSSIGQRGTVFLLFLSLVLVMAVMVANIVFASMSSLAELPAMIKEINAFNGKIIEGDLWEMNLDRLQTDVAVLINIPLVTWAKLSHKGTELAAAGKHSSTGRLDVSLPLYGRGRFEHEVVGTLQYQIDTDSYQKNLVGHILTNLTWQSIFIVSLTLTVYFWLRRNVTNHLKKAASLLEGAGQGNLHRVFMPDKKKRGDELDLLFATIEDMRRNLVHEVKEHKLAERQIRQSLREKEILTAELYHRTKNNMFVISSLLKLHGSSLKDAEAVRAFEEMDTRLHAMSLVHEVLYKSKDLSRVSLKDYLTGLLEGLRGGVLASKPGIGLQTEISDAWLILDTAVPLGLAINELLINAIRHAFPAGASGQILVRVLQSPDRKTFVEVADNGVGLPDHFDPEHSGKVGFQTILAIIREQLRGEIRFIRDGGLRVQINFTDNLYSERV